MKGTVPRPDGPAPASQTATQSMSTQQEEPPASPGNRITLALFEEHEVARSRGYDPYNAVPVRRPADVRKDKPKRD